MPVDKVEFILSLPNSLFLDNVFVVENAKERRKLASMLESKENVAVSRVYIKGIDRLSRDGTM